MAELPIRPQPASLIPLLDYLAAVRPDGQSVWAGWQVCRIAGGYNSILYRVVGEGADLAVKFTPRDARDRASREYRMLLALQQLGLQIAPAPVLLERDRYPQPVVVQTWLEGQVSSEPPGDDAGWELLLGHLAAIHAVTPERAGMALPPATVSCTQARHCVERFRRELELLPPAARPAGLRELARRLEATHYVAWQEPALALCRCDPTPLNFVRRPGAWASVDWENGGWSDPGFELADLMAHPAYCDVPPERWAWLIATYSAWRRDDGPATRIPVYLPLTLAWWAARFAREAHALAQGLERQRLVQRPAGWQAGVPHQYERYLQLALSAL